MMGKSKLVRDSAGDPWKYTVYLLVVLHVAIPKCMTEKIYLNPATTHVTMSTVLQYNNLNYSAQNAIDGNTRTDPDGCDCCALTDNGNLHGWWQIDLGRIYSLENIVIIGRSDSGNVGQIRPFNVYVGITETDTSMTLPIFNGNPNQNFYIYNKTGSLPRPARYVRIEKGAVGIMAICELELYGSATAGMINTTGMTANESSPYCPASGAIDGIINYTNTSRDNDTNGLCSACSAALTANSQRRWRLDMGRPHLVKAVGIYGRIHDQAEHSDNLTLYASNSTEGQQRLSHIERMDRTEHFRYVILPSSHLFRYLAIGGGIKALVLCEVQLFEAVCETGSFGESCLHTCHCHDTRGCDFASGHCHHGGCIAGWAGERCDKACISPEFGKDCNDTCNCFNGSLCDHVTGHCPIGKCASGWQGDSCNQKCTSPNFGQDCIDMCHCYNNASCDNTNGHCSNRRCDVGWQGVSCTLECPSPSFGQDCNDVCHCNGSNEMCDHKTGRCSSERCDAGWQGKSCNEKIFEEITSSTTSMSFADGIGIGAGGSSVIFLIALVAVILVCRNKTKREQKEENHYETAVCRDDDQQHYTNIVMTTEITN